MLTYFPFIGWFCLLTCLLLTAFAKWGVLTIGHLLTVQLVLLILTILFLAWPVVWTRAP